MAKRIWTAKMRADFRKRMVAAKKKQRSTGFKVGKKTGKPKAVSARKRRVSKLARSTVKTVRKPSRVSRSRGLGAAFHKPGFVILAINKEQHRAGYYAGATFDTDRKKAAVFESREHALQVAKKSTIKFPRGWRLAVAPADFSPEEEFPHFLDGVKKKRRGSNPAPRGAEAERVSQAARLFEDFTGHQADSMDKVVWKVPDVAVQFGRLEGVMYSTVRDGKHERYLHKFKGKSQPLLGASHDGKQLVIVGGRYQFTDAGIEDR